MKTNNILRAEFASKTTPGLSIANDVRLGNLVADGTISAVVARRLAMPDALKGFLLDGFPRTVGQAESLDELLGFARLDLVVELVVDAETIVERIRRRAEPAVLEGLPVRPDDNPESVRARLAAHASHTVPLTRYYQKRNRLFRLSGEAEPQFVSHQTVSRLSLLRY